MFSPLFGITLSPQLFSIWTCLATSALSTLQSHYASFRLSTRQRRSQESYRSNKFYLRWKAGVSILHSISFRARKKQQPSLAVSAISKQKEISFHPLVCQQRQPNVIYQSTTQHTSTLSPSLSGATLPTNFCQVIAGGEISVSWQTDYFTIGMTWQSNN